MHRYALLVVAAVAVAPAAGAQEKPPMEGPATTGFWTAAELDLLDRGLDAINATRADLAFQKRPIDDPFRLAVVNRALDDPLSVGREAQAWDDAARTGDPVALEEGARSVLEHAGKPPANVEGMGPRTEKLRDRLPDGRTGAIFGLLVDVGALVPFPFVQGGLKDEGRRAALLRKMLLSQVEKPSWVPEAADMSDADFVAAAQGVTLDDETAWAREILQDVQAIVEDLRPAGASATQPWTGRFAADGGGSRKIVLYGYSDDVHEADEDAVLVIDLGGNDTWTRGASASVLKNRPVSVCIDLAGNDRYVGREDLSFGAALGGVAIQWDCAGDDLYDAGHASLGAGICGVGVLVDEGGDDVYRCRDFGIGAGAFGIGVFLDKGGNDLYHCDLHGEGFASTRGCGVLVDMAGNDVYDAGGVHLHAPLYADRHQSLSQGFSIGMRPDASGGVGVLVDLKGNDRYTADIYGQGASYWYSLGILVDDDGNDTYNLGQYGQGSGIHLSAGILVDRAGSDLYYLKNGVGMGGAHDYAVGMLVDRGGDDYYAGSGGTQGGALTNSVAILLDGGGNDGYAAVQEGAQGYASPARGTGGIGLLLDAGGKDVHTERARDETVWSKELVGAGVDEPSPTVEGGVGDPGATSITPEKAKEVVDRDGMVDGPDGKRADDLEKLWAVASRWEVGDERVIVPIARERLVALGTPALEKALARVGDRHGLEFHACQAVFAKFPKDVVVPRLVERTKDADLFVRRRSVQALGTLGDAAAMPRLLEMLEKDAEVRSTVLGTLAGMKKSPPQVAGYLSSAKEADGVQAALCLASVGDEAAVQALLGALGHDHAYPVRLAALDRLGAMGAAAVPTLTLFVEDETRSVPARRNALRALARSKDPGASLPILHSFGSPERGIRLSAYMAAGELAKSLGAEDAKVLTDAVVEARAKETDPFLKRAR